MPGQPSKIGKYDVIRVVGRGGMGMVYQAIDPTIGRTVAIKTVTAVLSDDPEFLKRFYREAQSTGKLQHPNIVTLYDLGEQDGVPYLVMEYLEGDSLEKIIREKRPYAVADKLNILTQVCEGLGYAHQRQIIHRDVKPANIVVLNDGGVKIVDFGIAQFGNERFTRTGQVIGSMYYMSPEQIQDADIDSGSDIYSAGVVLFEFLSGSLPFQGKDPTSTLAKILNEPPPSLMTFVDAYSEELDQILGRALAKQRSQRYTSMEDFAFDLRSLQERLSRDLIAKSLQTAENCVVEKDWERARTCLRQVLKLDRQHRRANELLRQVQTQLHRQEIEQQVRQFRMKADDALALRNWDEALAALDQAIKIDSSNSELIELRASVRRSSALLAEALRRAESAYKAGDLDSAKRAVEEALVVDPVNTTAKALNAIVSKEITERAKRKQMDDLLVRARKDIALRRFTSALELLRSAQGIDPSITEVQQLIRSAAAGQEQERRRQALEQACSQIEALLNRDQYDAACARADEALVSFPQDLGLLKLKGFAEKQRDAWARHQFVESQLAGARLLVDSGALGEAQSLLNQGLERYPDDAAMISLLGSITESIARQEAERQEAERLANERRRYIGSQLEAAAELERAGQTSQALSRIRDGLFRYPDSTEFHAQVLALEESLARQEAARKRAEQEKAAREKADVEKAVADSWQLLRSKQTEQAVVMLEQALLRHSDSAELKSQLEFAKRRLAVEQAERDRAEQEARRRRAEIQKEISAAQALLQSRQIDQAVAALEAALARYSDDEQIQSLLQVSRQRQSLERAQREQAESDLRRRQSDIQKEIVAARQLLDANRLGDSIASLQRALAQYADSDELRSALAYARQRQAEETARERAKEEERRKRIWVDEQIALTSQWLKNNQSEQAATSLLDAVKRYPDSNELKRQLEIANRRLAAERAERERAEQAALQREHIQKQIAIAQQWLNSNRTDEAVLTLEKALQRYPDSVELRSQLETARSLLAEEQAEGNRIAEEQRRRAAEIAREILSARELLQAKKASRALTALQLSTRKYPESDELRSLLRSAQEILEQDKAEQEKAARQAEARRQQIAAELQHAKSLFESKQTGAAVSVLQQALERYSESEELRFELASAREQLAREQAEREQAEKKRARIQAEITRAQTLLEGNDPEEALGAAEAALRELGKNPDLETLLERAKSALKLKRAEEKKLAEDRKRREKQELQRQHALAELKSLAESARSTSKKSALGKSLRRARQIAQSYPDGVEFQNALTAVEAALAEALSDPQKPVVTEAPPATKMFASGSSAQIQSVPAEPEALPLRTPQPAPLLPRVLTKWAVIAVVALAGAAILIREAATSRKTVAPEKYTLSVQSQPIGAKVEISGQTCITPNCSLILPPGHYTIEAQLQGYRSYSEPVIVDPGHSPAPVTLVLVPEPPPETAGYLLVKAGVEGMEVVVNGKKYSQTNSSGDVRLALDPGPYTVEVRKKDYAQPKSARVEITRGKETLAEFHLTPLSTKAELLITNAIPNAEVLDGIQRIGVTGPDGIFSASLEPGSHDIALALEGRRSNTMHQSFLAGQRSTLDGKVFAIQPAAPAMIDVAVAIFPRAASLKVDGTYRYQTDSSGTAHFRVAPGNHELEIIADGFYPKTIQQNFSPGQPALNVSLEPMDREPQEWAQLQSTDDIAALQAFLNKYPNGNDVAKAQSRLDQLIASNRSEQDLRTFHDKFPATTAGTAALKRADWLRLSAQHVAEEKGIQAALDKFNASFQHHQARELKEIWPKADKKYLDAMHPPAGTTFAMSLQRDGVTAFSDRTAVVPCYVVSETTVAGHSSTNRTKKAVKVRLYKTDTGWLIADPFGQ